MTGPEHFKMAEELLKAAHATADPENDNSDEEVTFLVGLMMQRAQIHATLATAPGDDSLREQVDGLREAVRSLSEELAAAFTRIGVLDERLHDHEQTVPHAEAQA